MKIRYLFLTVVILLTIAPLRAQQQTGLGDYIKANYTKREVMIPMRDGVRLFTSIYEPKDRSKKYPILMNRTPYTVGPYGADKFKGSLGPNELFAKEGYIFVYQDVRGRWMSEGEFEDVRPDIDNKTKDDIDESTDTYDTIDWLIRNLADNNGKVGTYGISYPGFYTSAGSIDSHPALKACSPQAPVSDWFRGDDMHHNGALFLAQNYSFFTGFGQYRPSPTNNGSYLKPFNFRTQDGYNYYLGLGGLKETSDNYERVLGTRIKFWDQMMEHPNYDRFWKERNILNKLKNIGCATMTVGGWYDNEDLYGALRTYQAIEKLNPNHPFNVLVMGPWFHGGWERSDGDWLGTAYFEQKTSLWYRRNMELPFFEHFLKGVGDISGIKEVNTFDTGSREWRSFEGWQPSDRVTEKKLFLQANGRLVFDSPGATRGSDEYISDPMNPVPYTQKITANYPRDFMTEDQRFAASRPDVLVYESEPLTEDLTVAGDIHPTLFVSSSGTDSDFVVKLIDVFPDDYNFPAGVKPPDNSAWSVFHPNGYQMLLRGEPFPARFRNSFEKPEPLVPNKMVKIQFEMPGVVHTFKKGHRIMVQIQSTWFPLVARNPQKFMANYLQGTQADFQKATERVFHSSYLGLPIMTR